MFHRIAGKLIQWGVVAVMRMEDFLVCLGRMFG